MTIMSGLAARMSQDWHRAVPATARARNRKSCHASRARAPIRYGSDVEQRASSGDGCTLGLPHAVDACIREIVALSCGRLRAFGQCSLLATYLSPAAAAGGVIRACCPEGASRVMSVRPRERGPARVGTKNGLAGESQTCRYRCRCRCRYTDRR
ncbi:hypothetical protein GY45DRAFT_926976 [Cubamyces sp. BRFM 1775]|nr:hypothetical protein GY45DRAFT_926976 [Cubamyces sp. BRFM 1775]